METTKSIKAKTKTNQPDTDFINKTTVWKKIKRHPMLYLLILVPLAITFTFQYYPMYGVTLAFKDYDFRAGILGSEWVGLKYFEDVIKTPNILNYVWNTVRISVTNLVYSFPLPIILALALNNVRSNKFKKTVQLVTYAPHFISTVVLVGMLQQIFALRGGLVNTVLVALGGDPINILGDPSMFDALYVGSGIWQNAGYSAIIYIAALAGVDPTLYEAAEIDGASSLRKVIHIDIPSIAPTIIILLILSVGNILSVGFEKVFLMQNPLNYNVSEIISTYVYKTGLLQARYSFSTAVGLLNSIINLTLLIIVNKISRKVSETSLW